MIIIGLIFVLVACDTAVKTTVNEEQVIVEESIVLPESIEAHVEEMDDDEIELVEIPPLTLIELKQLVDTTVLPSTLQGVRFIRTGSQSFTNEVHVDDGRNFPVGIFKAYFLTGHEIEISINYHQPIYEYELFYAHAFRIAKNIGQLPLILQDQISEVTLIPRSSRDMQLNQATLSVGVERMDQLRNQGMVLSTLLRIHGFGLVMEQLLTLDTNIEINIADLETHYWRSLANLEEDDALKILFTNNNILLSEEYIQTLSPTTIPKSDTMNISSLGVGEGLVNKDDLSTLVEVSFLENGTRYHVRGANWTGYRQGSFKANIFVATYLDGSSMNIVIENSIPRTTANEIAQQVGFIYGQVPDLLRAGMRDFIMLPGLAHPSSGPVTTFYVDAFYGMGNRVEEGFIHDMAHASLDWPSQNRIFDIKDNRTLLSHPGVTTREGWLSAAKLDDFYVSTYAQDHPEREDIAESIIHYLIVRWRPERFDPYLVKFIMESIPNRIAYFDTFDFGFPESYSD